MPNDIIIIGAGLAGLTAGVYAQLNGYNAIILEHHDKPGGVVATWKRGDYTIDGGMHFLMGQKPGTPLYDLYTEVGVMPGTETAPMEPYMRYMDEATGRSITLSSDLDKTHRTLLAAFPDDEQLINELIAGAEKIGRGDFGFGQMEKPPELTTFTDTVKMFWGMRSTAKYYTGKYSLAIKDYSAGVKDSLLRDTLNNVFMPESPVWFVMMMLGILGAGQAAKLKNGSLDFARRIEKKFTDLGGQIKYCSTVKEIIVEADRAVGVRLETSEEYRAGAVISAADGHSTIFDMLGGAYADLKTKERYEKWPLLRPFVAVNFGVDMDFDGEPSFGVYRADPPLAAGDMVFDQVGTRIFNYSKAFSPKGKTVVQIYLETDWEPWEALRSDIQAYKNRKTDVARVAAAFMERQYPGFENAIEMTDVSTPYTMWRYTRNWKGAYEGWLPAGDLILKTIPRTLPGLKDFYMAGQWVIPGGGVPTSMLTGMHAVQLLCRRDKKTFRRS